MLSTFFSIACGKTIHIQLNRKINSSSIIFIIKLLLLSITFIIKCNFNFDFDLPNVNNEYNCDGDRISRFTIQMRGERAMLIFSTMNT